MGEIILKVPKTFKGMVNALMRKYKCRHVDITKSYQSHSHNNKNMVRYTVYVSGNVALLHDIKTFKELRMKVGVLLNV